MEAAKRTCGGASQQALRTFCREIKQNLPMSVMSCCWGEKSWYSNVIWCSVVDSSRNRETGIQNLTYLTRWL